MTQETPKPPLEVDRKPLIAHTLETLVELEVEENVVAYRSADVIDAFGATFMTSPSGKASNQRGQASSTLSPPPSRRSTTSA